MPSKRHIDDIKKESISLGTWEIMDNEYINSRSKLRVRCIRNKHPHFMSWDNIKQNKGCKECNKLNNKNKLKIDFISQSFEKEGYKLLTKVYKNNRQKLDYICSKGHRYYITWVNWQQGKRCFMCNGKKKLGRNYVSNVLSSEGYKLIGNYKNVKTSINYMSIAII